MPRAAVVVDLYGQCADYDRIVPPPRRARRRAGRGRRRGHRRLGRRAPGRLASGVAAVLSASTATSSSPPPAAAPWSDRRRAARRPLPAPRHPGPRARPPLRARRGRLQLPPLQPARPPSVGASSRRLAERIERRRAIRARYAEVLGDLPGVALNPIGRRAPRAQPLAHLHHRRPRGRRLRRPTACASTSRRPTSSPGPTWKPMHLQPVFAGRAARRRRHLRAPSSAPACASRPAAGCPTTTSTAPSTPSRPSPEPEPTREDHRHRRRRLHRRQPRPRAARPRPRGHRPRRPLHRSEAEPRRPRRAVRRGDHPRRRRPSTPPSPVRPRSSTSPPAPRCPSRSSTPSPATPSTPRAP